MIKKFQKIKAKPEVTWKSASRSGNPQLQNLWLWGNQPCQPFQRLVELQKLSKAQFYPAAIEHPQQQDMQPKSPDTDSQGPLFQDNYAMLAETRNWFSLVLIGFGVEQNRETSGLCKDSTFSWSCKRHWSTSAEHSDLRQYPKHTPERLLWLNPLLFREHRLLCFQERRLHLQSHQLGLSGSKLLSQEPAELPCASAHRHMPISQPAKLLLVQVGDGRHRQHA